MRTLLCLFLTFIISKTQSERVGNLVLLKDAVKDGAVCLDGSAAGYFIDRTPSKRWIIHLEGGGWCYSEGDCYNRSFIDLGSSKNWQTKFELAGFLNNDPDVNPNFANYSVVFVPYCDGASFSGNRDEPVVVNGRKIYFRGHRILTALVDALIENEGLKEAEAIILTGCSAGGLATFLHLDYVRSRFPYSEVHGLADAGYFVDAPNVNKDMHARRQFQYIFHMQNCSEGVNRDCIESNEIDGWQCFMAQYTYPYIQTPIFVLNSLYDTWQLGNILQLGCNPPDCNNTRMLEFFAWRTTFLNALKPVIQWGQNGVFADACLQHCQSVNDIPWSIIKVWGQNAHDTFSDWYINKRGTRTGIDGVYPNNPTCGDND